MSAFGVLKNTHYCTFSNVWQQLVTASCAENKNTKLGKLASKSSYKYGATKQKLET